jgi:two-component system cell cycle response regulator
MMGDKERVLAAGFDGYMSKPVSLFTFIKDLRAAVESTHALWASPQAAEPLSAPVPTPLPTVTAVPAAAPTPSETVSPVPAPAPVESHEVKS